MAAPNRTDVAFVPIDDLRVRATLVAVTRAGTPSPVIDAFVAALAASHDGVKPR
ncbi:hypothetical protein D3C85_1714290 [compost metagenome]